MTPIDIGDKFYAFEIGSIVNNPELCKNDNL